MDHILNCTKDSLIEFVTSAGHKKFSADQIREWIFTKGVTNFDEMSNLSKQLRSELKDFYSSDLGIVSKELISFDETRKWLVQFSDNNEIEVVFIPEETRGTLCVSSQVGCTLNCTFCHTGTQKLVRNLTSGEILSQILIAKNSIGDFNRKYNERKLTNIVFMGMGEPLLNYENVVQAIKDICDPKGLAFPNRRVTLSTSGIVPNIIKLNEDGDVNLAISLHAVTNEIRDVLVPINKKYPIEQLIEACRNYKSPNGKITFEYVMLKGVNDSMEHAKKFVKLIRDIPAIINIIPFNPWPGTIYECSDQKTINEFSSILQANDLICTIRTPRGQDILAACGQLKSESIKERRLKSDNVN